MVGWMFSNSHGSPSGIEPSLANSSEGGLVYPGAENVRKSGVRAECRDGLWQRALLDVSFMTTDTTEAVDTWYLQQLSPLGWHALGDPAASYLLDRGNNDGYFLVDKRGPG